MPLQATPEQEAICNASAARVIVHANAGAGKTTTAALKIARWIAQGMDPRRIVALSYSASGAQAYAQALRRVGLSEGMAEQVRVGTMEDFCASRLHRFEGFKPSLMRKPEDVRRHVMAAIGRARTWALDKFGVELSVQGSGEFAVEGLLDEFAYIKGAMLMQRQGEYFRMSPEWAAELGVSFTTLAILGAYETLRCQGHQGDGEQTQFRYGGDATYDLARLLAADDPSFTHESHPLRLGLQAVVLDEMHDTHWAMFTVLKALLERNDGAVFLGLGDADQVVHAGIGADADLMGVGFRTYLGAFESLPLTETYRFGPAIAQPLGLHAGKPYPSHAGLVSQLTVRATTSVADVLGAVWDAMRAPSLSSKAQVAVLLRHPSAAVTLEHALRSQATPYETVGFTTYLERPEVLYARVLLGLAVGLPEKFSADMAERAKRASWAFLSAHSTEGAEAQAAVASQVEAAHPANFFDFMLPDALALNDTRVLRFGIDAAVQKQIGEALALASGDQIADLPRIFRLLDLGRTARRVLVREQDALDVEASMAGLVQAAQGYASISSFLASLMAHDYAARTSQARGDRIRLSTIEDAKGLEFEQVVIPDVNVRSFDGSARDERNLFYVAVSRAKQGLTITHQEAAPSAYLRYFRN